MVSQGGISLVEERTQEAFPRSGETPEAFVADGIPSSAEDQSSTHQAVHPVACCLAGRVAAVVGFGNGEGFSAVQALQGEKVT